MRFRAPRRVFALAVASGRDLFSGQGALLAILLFVGVLAAAGETRGISVADSAALAVRQRLELFVELAAAATLLGAAHLAAEDRRTQRLAQWRTTPLTPIDAALGRLLGITGAAFLLAAPLLTIGLLAPADGLLHRRAQFEPRPEFVAAKVERVDAAGSRSVWRGKPGTLALGESMTFDFAVAAEGTLTFRFPIALAGERSEGTATVELREGATLLATRQLGDRALLEGALPIAAPDGRGTNHALTLSVSAGGGVIRCDPGECRLTGEAGSIASALARAVVGLAVVLAFAAALGGALGGVLSEGLAASAGIVLLLLSTLRPLFDTAGDFAVHDHGGGGASTGSDGSSPSIGETTRLVSWLARLLPDLTGASGSESIAHARPPFGGTGDGHEFLRLFAWIVGLVLLAAALQKSGRSHGGPLGGSA